MNGNAEKRKETEKKGTELKKVRCKQNFSISPLQIDI